MRSAYYIMRLSNKRLGVITMKLYKVGILGATGAVGREMMKILAERQFPISELRLFASSRSAGKVVEWNGRPVMIQEPSEENFRGIAAIMLGELKTALEEHGVALRWDESVIDYLVQKSYTLTYGARNLRRTIQKDIEDVVAEKLIDSYENPITAIGLQAQDGKLELSCL